MEPEALTGLRGLRWIYPLGEVLCSMCTAVVEPARSPWMEPAAGPLSVLGVRSTALKFALALSLCGSSGTSWA